MVFNFLGELDLWGLRADAIRWTRPCRPWVAPCCAISEHPRAAVPDRKQTVIQIFTMKAIFSLAFAAGLASLSQAVIFNKTAAYAPGNFEKYKVRLLSKTTQHIPLLPSPSTLIITTQCINTEDINKMFPECLRQCQRNANAADGCAYNDFACHCINYDVYSPVRTSLFSPPFLRLNTPTDNSRSPARRNLRLPTRARRHRHLHARRARPSPRRRDGPVQFLQRHALYGHGRVPVARAPLGQLRAQEVRSQSREDVCAHCGAGDYDYGSVENFAVEVVDRVHLLRVCANQNVYLSFFACCQHLPDLRSVSRTSPLDYLLVKPSTTCPPRGTSRRSSPNHPARLPHSRLS